MNKEFLKMQKTAGLITESEYNENINTAHYVDNDQGAGLDSILRTLEYIYDAGARGQEVNLKQLAINIKDFFQK
jgi:hypothetical protein